jgi:hypothetical protein
LPHRVYGVGGVKKARKLPRWGTSLTPREQKMAKLRGYLSMLIDLILLGTIFGITNNNETGAWACNKNMVIWLYVFGGYLGA